MSALDELLNAALEKAESEAAECQPEDLLIDVFRKHYENWTQRLFPAWKSQKRGSTYELLAELLRQGGHPNITSNMVAVYMKRVRDERSKKGVSQKKEILKSTSQGVTPTVVNSESFVPIDRDWRAVEKLAKESTEWSSDLEAAWNHLKWLADDRKIPPAARPLMDTWLNLGGEPMKSAWLQLKRRRRENSLPVEM